MTWFNYVLFYLLFFNLILLEFMRKSKICHLNLNNNNYLMFTISFFCFVFCKEIFTAKIYYLRNINWNASFQFLFTLTISIVIISIQLNQNYLQTYRIASKSHWHVVVCEKLIAMIRGSSWCLLLYYHYILCCFSSSSSFNYLINGMESSLIYNYDKIWGSKIHLIRNCVWIHTYNVFNKLLVNIRYKTLISNNRLHFQHHQNI